MQQDRKNIKNGILKTISVLAFISSLLIGCIRQKPYSYAEFIKRVKGKTNIENAKIYCSTCDSTFFSGFIEKVMKEELFDTYKNFNGVEKIYFYYTPLLIESRFGLYSYRSKTDVTPSFNYERSRKTWTESMMIIEDTNVVLLYNEKDNKEKIDSIYYRLEKSFPDSISIYKEEIYSGWIKYHTE